MLTPLTKYARDLRNYPTESERRLWRELRHKQIGFRFRRQFNIGPYIVDFACPERKIIVELDGGHHQYQVDRDAKRTTWLESQGYTVLRFWNSDVENNMTGVRQVIEANLRPPHLSPPPQGGRRIAE